MLTMNNLRDAETCALCNNHIKTYLYLPAFALLTDFQFNRQADRKNGAVILPMTVHQTWVLFIGLIALLLHNFDIIVH